MVIVAVNGGRSANIAQAQLKFGNLSDDIPAQNLGLIGIDVTHSARNIGIRSGVRTVWGGASVRMVSPNLKCAQITFGKVFFILLFINLLICCALGIYKNLFSLNYPNVNFRE